MESLTPSLRLILVLRETLERGDSVRNAIRDFVHHDSSGFAKKISLWMVERENGKAIFTEQAMWPSERFLVRVLDRGLRGEAILVAVKELEAEIIQSCEAQMDEFVELLPLKTLIPLLLFVFPGYLLLLVGPFVSRMVQSLQ